MNYKIEECGMSSKDRGISTRRFMKRIVSHGRRVLRSDIPVKKSDLHRKKCLVF